MTGMAVSSEVWNIFLGGRQSVMWGATYLEAQGLNLHGVCGRQSRQQAALMREVFHDALPLELWPRARIAKGNADPNLGCVNCSLGNQHTACTRYPSCQSTVCPSLLFQITQ